MRIFANRVFVSELILFESENAQMGEKPNAKI